MSNNNQQEKSVESEIKKPIEIQVAEWSAEKAEIAELIATANGITVAGHVDGPKKGRQAVHDALMPLWRRRCALDNREKELLEIPKAITAKIKATKIELAAPLIAAEDRLRADRDAYDAEQKRIEDARVAEEKRIAAEQEAERRRVLQSRIDQVVALGGMPSLGWLGVATEEAFAEHLAELQAAKDAREEAARIERERLEAARVAEEAERAERERLESIRRQEEAEAQRKADEDAREEAERIERERLEAIRAAEEVARAERAELAKQKAAIEAERARLAKEREEQEAREAARQKAIRDEQERVAAAERAELARLERERIAAEEAEEAAREAARLEAERPAYQIAAAWARQALATLPAIPTLDMPDDLFIRVERTREDIEDLLTVLAAEMDAEGGVA